MNRASLLVVTAQREELDPLILCIRAHGQTVKPLAAGRLSAVLAPALGTIFAVGGMGRSNGRVPKHVENPDAFSGS